jgi:Cys-tRNA(Pro)/Cys-tRNA(Cys) deacylase
MTPAVAFLKAQNISFELIEYQVDTAHNIGIAAAHAMGLDENQVFKTLIASIDERQPVSVIIPVATQLHLKRLGKVSGGKSAAMAEIRVAEQATGYVTGGISPFGQKKPLPTFLAEQALDHERIYVSGGKRGLEIAVATEDLIRSCHAEVCKLTRED